MRPIELNEADLPLGKRLYRLLNRPTLAVPQILKGDGWGYGGLKRITERDYCEHLEDIQCFALHCVGGRALFLCIDVDKEFPARLRIIGDILRGRGIDEAAFSTPGSDAGRGKVIITLAEPLDQALAQATVKEIVTEASLYPEFGSFEGTDISLRPTAKMGGNVRIAGRNRMRDGPIEVVLNLDGEPSDLKYVVPWKIVSEGNNEKQNVSDDLLAVGVELERKEELHHIRSTAAKGETRAIFDSDQEKEHTDIHNTTTVYRVVGLPKTKRGKALLSVPYEKPGKLAFDDLFHLAQQAVKVATDGLQARILLGDWVAMLLSNSPKISAGARRQFTNKAALDRVIRYVLEGKHTGPSNIGSWEPQMQEEWVQTDIRLRKPSKEAWRVYAVMASFVVENPSIDPHALGMDFLRLADFASYGDDKRRCHKAVSDASDAGLLFRLHKGQKTKEGKGNGGLVTLYTLVGKGEGLQQAYDLGINTAAYQKRLQCLREKGLPLPDYWVWNGVPCWEFKEKSISGTFSDAADDEIKNTEERVNNDD